MCCVISGCIRPRRFTLAYSYYVMTTFNTAKSPAASPTTSSQKPISWLSCSFLPSLCHLSDKFYNVFFLITWYLVSYLFRFSLRFLRCYALPPWFRGIHLWNFISVASSFCFIFEQIFHHSLPWIIKAFHTTKGGMPLARKGLQIEEARANRPDWTVKAASKRKGVTRREVRDMKLLT